MIRKELLNYRIKCINRSVLAKLRYIVHFSWTFVSFWLHLTISDHGKIIQKVFKYSQIR